MNAVHVFSQQAACVFGCRDGKFSALPQSFVMLCIAYTSDSKLDGVPFCIYYIHRHVAAGFASGQRCQPVESCLEGTTSMYSHYCFKCSWCLGRFSGSWGWQVAAIQRRPGEVFSQQASCVFGRRCAKLGTVPSALKLSILYWTGMVEWAGWPCNFFCIHRHCSTGFASCRTCQCVKICLERTTSKCSHVSCLECTCMSCRNCLRGSHAIWPLPGWRGWQVAAMQQTAIHVFSQQASCVLGPSCATFVAFSSRYRWVGGRRATTECSPIYICDDLGDMG